MKRTTRNAAKTKQEIIEKSAVVFNVNGYSGTTMQMLVDASGYQMGGIYRHFPTKMDLAKAVFQYNYKTLIQKNLTFENHLNPKEKLLTIISNYKKMVFRPSIKGGCPILNTAVEVDDTNDAFRQLTKSSIEEVLKKIEIILEEGKNLKLFKPDLDIKNEALYLFATFEGAILIGKTTRSSQAILSIFNQIEQYLKTNIFCS